MKDGKKKSIRLTIFTSTIALLFFRIPLHWSVSWFVFLFFWRITQKLTEQISMTLGGRMGQGPRKKPLKFGADPDTQEGIQELLLFF